VKGWGHLTKPGTRSYKLRYRNLKFDFYMKWFKAGTMMKP